MIKKLFMLLLTSRIHVSVIFFFILNNFHMSFGNSGSDYLLWSLTLWHYALYLFDRVHDWKIDAEYQQGEAIPQKSVRSLFIVVAILLLLSLTLFFVSGYPVLYWICLFPLTFLYTYPLFFKKRIKQILFIKNLYSAAIVWCLPIFILVYLETGSLSFDPHFVRKLISLMGSVLLIEAFWDIRDKEGDRDHNIQTLPNVFGILYTKIYLAILLILTWDFNLFTVTMCFLIIIIQENSPKFYFHLPIFCLIAKYLIRIL